MKRFVVKIQRLFSSPQLDREAFEAYLYRLPASIEVSWTRDSGYIVGTIKDTEQEYMTQAQSQEEFVDMVNDAVYTMHDIPEEYRDAVRSFQAYKPSSTQLKELGDLGVKSARLSVRRAMRAA